MRPVSQTTFVAALDPSSGTGVPFSTTPAVNATSAGRLQVSVPSTDTAPVRRWTGSRRETCSFIRRSGRTGPLAKLSSAGAAVAAPCATIAQRATRQSADPIRRLTTYLAMKLPSSPAVQSLSYEVQGLPSTHSPICTRSLGTKPVPRTNAVSPSW